MRHQTNGVCAAVPITHLSLDAYFCHHHQAWTITVSVYTDQGDPAKLQRQLWDSTAFGPFDGHDLPRQFALDRLAEAWPTKRVLEGWELRPALPGSAPTEPAPLRPKDGIDG